MSNCESCWHLTRLHDEDGCHADRLSFAGGREEYCLCTEPPPRLVGEFWSVGPSLPELDAYGDYASTASLPKRTTEG